MVQQARPRRAAASGRGAGRGAAGRSGGRNGGRGEAAGEEGIALQRYGVVPSHFGDTNEARTKNFEKALKAFKGGNAFENWSAFLDVCVNQAMMIISAIGGAAVKVLIASLPRNGWRRQGEEWVRVVITPQHLSPNVEDQHFVAQQVFDLLVEVVVTASAARDRAADTEAERPAQRQRTQAQETFEDATDAVLSAAAAAAEGYPVANRGIPPPPASLATAADLHGDVNINAAVRALQQGRLFEAIQPNTTVSGMGPYGNRPAFGGGRAPQGGDRPPQGLDFANFSGGAAELWGQGAFSSNNMVLELRPGGGICAKEYGPTDSKTLVAKWQDVLRKLELEPGREVECEHIRNYITWMTDAFLGGIAFSTILAVDKDTRQRWKRAGTVTFNRAILDSAMAVVIATSMRAGQAPPPPRDYAGGGRGDGDRDAPDGDYADGGGRGAPEKLCYNFNKASGCTRGDGCKFAHTCDVCGRKGHGRSACTA